MRLPRGTDENAAIGIGHGGIRVWGCLDPSIAAMHPAALPRNPLDKSQEED